MATAGWFGLKALVGATVPPDVQVETSRLVLDRGGRLLRPFAVSSGRWRLPVALSDVDPMLIAMLLAFEDRRFHEHPGVDIRALLRAAAQVVANGRIVSGGSTLTMQLVRLLEGGSTRSLQGKLRQVLAALALERRVDKDAILTAYLTVAPYGGNIEGVRGASLAWFGREPKRLTAAQAALLVALPQSPEARRPDRDVDAARRARDRVLARARGAGIIDESEETAARGERIPTRRRSYPILAAHTAERSVRERPGFSIHRLTIDADLQERMERLAAERADALGPKVSVALLAADHRSGEVLASVGSTNLFDVSRDGFVDMTRAVRSPGSTLKPLIYGLAFEAGIAHPESLIEDRPTGFTGYVPGNFDRQFHGTVTVRRALQLSLNVPAVKVLDAVGPARLVSRMRRAGARPALSDLSPPGLAIGLGGVGVTLTDLVEIFGAIARGGRSLSLREIQDGPGTAGAVRRVLDERAAWYVASILAGAPTPANASVGDLAFKTGTSYGYRDAWAIGFDGRHLIGVWVGRPDGAPVPGLAGIDAAAPILIDAFARIGTLVRLPPAPPGVLIASSADLPPPLKRVSRARSESEESLAGLQVAFPPDGARVDLGLSSGKTAALALKVRNGSPPFSWFANGAPVEREPFSRTAYWAPDGPGYATLSVVDGRGQSSRVTVFLE
ncbi:MAG: penicillin-binding protein 1C [Pseudomonadota bacterium]|nr:penicillin-binding protein 1C [Pseudomonadota bacterium]